MSFQLFFYGSHNFNASAPHLDAMLLDLVVKGLLADFQGFGHGGKVLLILYQVDQDDPLHGPP